MDTSKYEEGQITCQYEINCEGYTFTCLLCGNVEEDEDHPPLGINMETTGAWLRAQSHSLTHPEITEEVFKCNTCPKKFYTLDFLTAHKERNGHY